MNTIDFFKRVLPRTGIFCLAQPQDNRFTHTWFDNVEAMAEHCDTLSDEIDIYYGMASFDASHTRKIENVTSLKSVWFDIDAGAKKFAKHGDKVYETREAAIADLRKFIAWLGVAPSMIVSSGDGLHVYYTFKNPIDNMKLWDLLATSLRSAANHFGLRIDAGLTTNKACVLRPANTMHNNGSRVKVLVDRGDVKATALVEACRPYMVAPVVEKKHDINDDLEMLPMPFAPTSVHKIAKKCKWVAESLEAKGNVPEPEWRSMLGLIKHTTEGEQFAHEWSSGHSYYDYRETQKKLDGWKKAPPTCDSVTCATCKGCEHNGKIKSMISLGILSDKERAASVPAKPAPVAEGNDFASMIWTGEDEPNLSVVSEPAVQNNTTLETIHGSQTRKELEKIVAGLDQRDELIQSGLLNESFPSYKELLQFNRTTPYFLRHSKGIITLYALHKIEKKIDGEVITQHVPLALTDQPFYISSHVQGRGIGEVNVHSVHQYVVLEKGKRRAEWQFTDHDVTELTDIKAFRKLITSLGVSYCDVSQSQLITTMLNNFANSNLGVLRSRNTAIQVPYHMGLQYNASTLEPMYIQGGYASDAEGRIQNCSLGVEIRTMKARFEMPFLSTDELRAYPKQGDVFNERIMPAARAFCDGVNAMYGSPAKSKYALSWLLGMASPYLPFVTDEAPLAGANVMPGMGIALSLYSQDSGVGKTSLQQVIVAAFASPEENKAGGNKETGQSAIALGANLTRLGSLPFMIDEVTNNDAETTSNLIHKISSGRDKSRANQQGKVVERTGTWASVTTMSTNVSQRVLLSQHREASIAEQMRVMEVCFDGVEKDDPSQWIGLYNEHILNNRGAVGMVLGRHGVMHWESMRQRAIENFGVIRTKMGLQNSERYFGKLFAAAMLVLDTLAEYGLHPVSKEIVTAEFERILLETREYLLDSVPTSEDSAEDLVNFLAPSIIMTSSLTDRRTKGGSSTNDVVYNTQVLNNRVKGRYVVATKRIYLIAAEVKLWTSKRGMDYPQTLRKWHETGLLIKQGSNFAGNIALNTGIHETVMQPLCARCIILNVGPMEDKVNFDVPAPDNVVSINQTAVSTTKESNNEAASQ